MGLKAVLLAAFAALIAAGPAAAQKSGERAAKASVAPVEVMVVGVYHFENPGLDLMNFKSDDVLAPQRQREIQQIVGALARFKPTKVAVERSAAGTTRLWAQYQAGELATSRNEIVQLGFRLARTTGAAVLGADVPGEFPFGPVAQFAEANGQGGIIAGAMAEAQAGLTRDEQLLKTGGIPAVLRASNEPAEIAREHGLYMQTLRVGKGPQQPGAELISTWYRRNAMICAAMIQGTQPGDRVVMFFGDNHSHLLRRCVIETPGLRLVEAVDYLPRTSSRRGR
jgi:hypothetical protein